MCTGLRYINDGFYFGRNLDLDYTFGQSIVITPKNYEIKFKHEKSIANHYAFIGVAVVVEDYPLYADAINEAGLGIANLNFPHFAEYATEVQEGQLNLAPYELMLYALANCQSVAEVKTAFRDLNVVDIPFNAQMPNTTLHWFVADKKQAAKAESKGQVATQATPTSSSSASFATVDKIIFACDAGMGSSAMAPSVSCKTTFPDSFWMLKRKCADFSSPCGLSRRSIFSNCLRRLWARFVVDARTILRATKSSNF